MARAGRDSAMTSTTWTTGEYTMAFISKFDPAFGTEVKVDVAPILKHMLDMDEEAGAITINNGFRAIIAELLDLAERMTQLEVMVWMESDE